MPEIVRDQPRPGRPARKWIDDVLMWRIKDMKDAVMMSEEGDGEDSWPLAPTVIVDHYGHC